MEYLAIFILGFIIGANYAVHTVRKQLHKVAKDMGITEEQPEEKIAPVLTLEKHGSTYYLFDKQTDTFLCQSNDISDLGQKLVQYKNINLAFVQCEGDQVFWFVNGQVTAKPQ